MTQYIGIDLGTTNSAICSYDGRDVQLHKSPEQTDVTPSALLYDRRGNLYVGTRAYANAARNPGNAATLFKRLMGTNTPIELSAVNKTLTPEECSAEVLKALYGYLPEEIRRSGETGTVITVPAAFNQMQKDATMAAASMAGLGSVALMQEPVAAVMCVMRKHPQDGLFLVYDLGGGTLDIAIAEAISGRVNLLSHGGISMCGGRDFDRILLERRIIPWLQEHFRLPENLVEDPRYGVLLRMAAWAGEKAKIELSSRDDSIIALSEIETGIRDEAGLEIYLDIPIRREEFNPIVAERVRDSIQSAREAIQKAGLTPADVEKIIFIGGPTQYKPLRDTVAGELGISSSADMNPMTAVAEGAAVFAESIDWSSTTRGRKSSKGEVTAGGTLDLAFHFIARTPDNKSKVAMRTSSTIPAGFTFQVDSLDTGWSSGRINLTDGVITEVPLGQQGENTFKVFLFDAQGGSIACGQDRIVISRTAATIDAIPSSSTLGVEVLDRLGGTPVLDVLVREGEGLPKKGTRMFRAGESLRAGGDGSINFKIWEGEIEHPISDNRLVGMLVIRGDDFADGVIAAGAELRCDYEVLDSGNIILEVSAPSIGSTFHSGRNFYSRQSGQLDFSVAAEQIRTEAGRVEERINDIAGRISNPKLEQARQRLQRATHMKPAEKDPETAKQSMEHVLEAKRLLARVRSEHLREIRQMDLDHCNQFFQEAVRAYARPAELSSFESLVRTAQRAIDTGGSDFERHLSDMRGKNFDILWRQDWFIVDRFNHYAESPELFPDRLEHSSLVRDGQAARQDGNIGRLREITWQLEGRRLRSSSDTDMTASVNILRG